jgi:hypothetical protein
MDYPDKNWNWTGLSENPNITWEIVRDYPDKPWDWNYTFLSRNPMYAFDFSNLPNLPNHPSKANEIILK